MLHLTSRRHVVIRLALLVACGFFCSASWAFTIKVDAGFEHSNLGKGLQYTASDASQLSAAQISAVRNWQTVAGKQVNFGFSDHAYLLKFTIENTSQQTQNLVLDIGNIYLDYIDLLVLDEHGNLVDQARLGDRVPANERSVHHAQYLHHLSAKPNQSLTVVMRVESSSAISVPLTLWQRNTFIEYDFKRTVSFGLFFGILIMLGLYHSVISLLMRDISLFYYATFIFSILVVFLLREGVVSAFIWPDAAFGTESANIIAVGTACWGISFFTSKILLLKNAMPTMDKLLKFFSLSNLIPGLLVGVIDYGLLIRISLSLALVLTILYVIALTQRVREKYPAAKHLITASCFAVIGITAAILTVLGVLPVNAISQVGIYGCITLMGLFYSLSISYRMNLDRALREEAQGKLANRLDELVREQTDELESIHNQLKTISITDGLTQLYNRRHLDNVFVVEYNRAYREGSPLSVLLLDIDHFKQLNDNHGHGFGDLCLVTAGKLLNKIARRPCDIAARYGGEEFVLLLPDTDFDGAYHMARRIKQAFAEQEVAEGDVSTVISVSIGVASEVPERKDQQEALLKRADQWLYKAKQNGRNRIEGDAVTGLA